MPSQERRGYYIRLRSYRLRWPLPAPSDHTPCSGEAQVRQPADSLGRAVSTLLTYAAGEQGAWRWVVLLINKHLTKLIIS